MSFKLTPPLLGLEKKMEDFETLLSRSAEMHGHLCPGQVIGVRMAMLGCRLIGIEDPWRDVKKLIVFVEIDRCASDSIAVVTGCKLGRRSLKFIDNGVMAATFLNLETSVAHRIAAREESRELALKYAPHIKNTHDRQLHAYQMMSTAELFRIQQVKVDLQRLDLPGPTRRKVVCAACGETVRDGREKIVNGQAYCRPCAGDSYFLSIESGEADHDVMRSLAVGESK